MKITGKEIRRYEEQISHSGLRFTAQRRVVFDSLLSERDHPTATELFLRAKKKMPNISLATVYNCLDTLVGCGLVKQVNLDREPTRYCPNERDHAHFVCEQCGKVFDIDCASQGSIQDVLHLPEGFVVTSQEINLRGTCGHCNRRN